MVHFSKEKTLNSAKFFSVIVRVRVRVEVRENLLDSNKVFAESNVVKFSISCSGDSCPYETTSIHACKVVAIKFIGVHPYS